jgi:hypothetical protein
MPRETRIHEVPSAITAVAAKTPATVQTLIHAPHGAPRDLFGLEAATPSGHEGLGGRDLGQFPHLDPQAQATPGGPEPGPVTRGPGDAVVDTVPRPRISTTLRATAPTHQGHAVVDTAHRPRTWTIWRAIAPTHRDQPPGVRTAAKRLRLWTLRWSLEHWVSHLTQY